MIGNVQEKDLFLGNPVAGDLRCHANNTWVASRYADVTKVLSHPDIDIDGSTRQLMERACLAWPDRYTAWRTIYKVILLQSGETHRLLRKVTGRLLKGPADLSDVCDFQKILQGHEAAGDIDAISSLIEPAIDTSMARLLGFTVNEMTHIRQSGMDVYKNLSVGFGRIKASDFEKASKTLVNAYSQVTGRSVEELTPEDCAIFFLCTVVLQPLAHTAANALACVASNPELQECVRNANGGDTAFWTEIERYFVSLRYIHRQIGGDGMSMDGYQLPAGARIICDIAAANRDPARWSDPQDFDPTRPPISNLTFGAGAHRCLGVALSRQFLPKFLGEVLRVAKVESGLAPPQMRCTLTVEEPIDMPIRITLLKATK
jgi:cytochrome P450